MHGIISFIHRENGSSNVTFCVSVRSYRVACPELDPINLSLSDFYRKANVLEILE